MVNVLGAAEPLTGAHGRGLRPYVGPLGDPEDLTSTASFGGTAWRAARESGRTY